MSFDLRKFSFGGPAAIVSSMALIIGLDAATASRATVVTSLLIIGVGDNLTDSFSVHVYQESEKTGKSKAFQTTAANFATRAGVTSSFVLIYLFVPPSFAIKSCILWGFMLLSCLSFMLARVRDTSVAAEILEHSGLAVVVIALSKGIGACMPFLMGAS
jgi:VIT1/CCC1 family predicted Fe2+/Mn2+ transporter